MSSKIDYPNLGKAFFRILIVFLIGILFLSFFENFLKTLEKEENMKLAKENYLKTVELFVQENPNLNNNVDYINGEQVVMNAKFNDGYLELTNLITQTDIVVYVEGRRVSLNNKNLSVEDIKYEINYYSSDVLFFPF